MTALEPTPTDHAHIAPRRDGNGVDLHYLEHALAALGPAMAASRAATARGHDEDVRSLARQALSLQTSQLAAISAGLLRWDRPEAAARAPGPNEAERWTGLHGAALDRAFQVQLTAHAHASISAARTEMVGGASPRARAIAEDSIRAQCQQLAALHVLSPVVV